MNTTGGQVDDPGEDLGGCGAGGGRPVAQLPVSVITPGPEAAVGLEGEGVITPTGQGNDPGEDLVRQGAVRGRPIAQLPAFVRAPGPKAAIGLEG